MKDLPIHLYDLGTGNPVKIPSEVMIPETREFEFASTGFIPLSYYKIAITPASSRPTPRRNRRCTIPPTPPPTAVSTRVCLYIFLLSRIAHYLKMIQRENIGTTKDRRLLELELNTGAEPGDRNDRPRRRAAGLPSRCAMPAWWWKISRITRASSA